MKRGLKGNWCEKGRPLLCTTILLISSIRTASLADRGDDILPLVQSEKLKAHIITLQENVQQTPTPESGRLPPSDVLSYKPIVYRTRSSYHRDAVDNAAQYIENQFRRSPRLQIELEEFRGLKNVVARLPARHGSTSDRIFILCAHYDSIANRDNANWNPLISEAPGANDNATGVAAMLEIAHLLSQFNYNHELRFIALDGAEIGRQGSRHHAKEASQAGENIVLVINIDMIGFNWITDLVEVLTDGSDNSSVWIGEMALIANKWYDIGLEVRPIRDGSLSIGDHRSFWEEDYRAVTFTESTTPRRDSSSYEANPFYHTFRDTVDKINMQLVRKVTQLVLVTLDGLASQSHQSGSTPRVTIDSIPVANQNPVQITGRFESDFPVEIVLSPGNVLAQIDRSSRTYKAEVTMQPGENLVRATVVYPLGASSVEQTVLFEPDFEWISAAVFPNPARLTDELTQLRGEGNLPMESMHIYIYASDGSLVKQKSGVPDGADPRIWRVWWNHQNASGREVATGVYVCKFEASVNGETYSRIKKLALVR
jgi:hypothetical protein